MWRYLFRRDDPLPAPWTPEGKANIAKRGYTCIYPVGYKEAEAEKEREKLAKEAEKKGGKRKISTDNPFTAAAAVKKPKVIYKIDEDVVPLIVKDEKNVKIWDEVQATEYETKLQFTDKLEEVFKCPICQDLLVDPVTLNCTHNICMACVKRILKDEKKECPYCRSELDEEDVKVNKELKEALKFIFPGYDA